VVKHILTGFILVFLVSCTQAEDLGVISGGNEDKEVKNPMEGPDLPLLGVAPELSNDVWLNTNESLRLSELEGNVILLEMWTFG
jgi:hypothetical protein